MSASDLARYRPRLDAKADDAEVVDRIYLLADAFMLAAKIEEDFIGAFVGDRRFRIDDLEAALTDPGNKYSVDMTAVAKRLTVYADAWQDKIDGEAT